MQFLMRCATLAISIQILSHSVCAAPPDSSNDPKAIDPYMGEYDGKLTLDGKEEDGIAQVIAEGDQKYRVAIMREFWKTAKDAEQFRVELSGEIDSEGNVPLAGNGWNGKLVKDKGIRIQADSDNTFFGRPSNRKSPTLGQQPPAGAIVLLPYQAGVKPALDEWTNPSWKPLESGAVEVGKGNIFTKRELGSIKLHVEFRCPYEPTKRGQGRGNSGVYLQKRFEVQVLESFGLKSQSNDCGSIYKVANTRVNASLPPLHWQTYDIDFTAARISPEGQVLRKPSMTVRHNGVLIHENQELPGATTAAAASGYVLRDALMLQDHGNKVEYRNIWVVPQAD